MKYKCLECGAEATAADSPNGVVFTRSCSHDSAAIVDGDQDDRPLGGGDTVAASLEAGGGG